MHRLTVASLLVLALACSERETVARRDTLTAQQILERTAAVYASAQTYRDAGSVLIDDPLLWKAFQFVVHGDTRHRFSTTFDRTRGGAFQFETRDGGKWTATVMPDPLRTLVGVSHGASVVVPPLLAPKQDMPAVTSLADATRERDAVVGGARCYVIRGTDARGRCYRLWIEQERLVIRKAESRAVANGVELSDTIEYEDVRLR